MGPGLQKVAKDALAELVKAGWFLHSCFCPTKTWSVKVVLKSSEFNQPKSKCMKNLLQHLWRHPLILWRGRGSGRSQRGSWGRPGPHGEQWMCGSFRMWAQGSLRQHILRDEIFKGLSSFSHCSSSFLFWSPSKIPSMFILISPKSIQEENERDQFGRELPD